MTPPSSLHVGKVGGRSVLLGARAHAPLKLLNPAHPGPAAWVYQSSYGGGLVAADAVHLEARVDPGAALFLSTQASGKVYRTARAELGLTTTVGAGGALVSWPDPTVCFAGAGLAQRQRHALHPTASLLAVEVLAAGRLARGEAWAFDAYAARLEVTVDGRRVLDEALHLTPEAGPLPDRLQGVAALATVALVGPALEAERARVAEAAAVPREGVWLAASPHRGALVVRGAAAALEPLLATLKGLLRPALLQLLEEDPLARKW